ncbi:MAG TPA: tetratricopeptide repeat protein [Blastocatellia bacterium]|nr:tetratricopeptide repeat protein [Blastocatellia bacterium]
MMKPPRPAIGQPSTRLRSRHVVRSLLLAAAIGSVTLNADAQPSPSSRPKAAGRGAPSKVGALRVITGKPGSVVYLVNVRQGVTNDAGLLDMPRLKAGAYSMRVRTKGHSDWRRAIVVPGGATRTVRVTQPATVDQAELRYQEADELRESGKLDAAVAAYNQAIELRPALYEARIGLARCLISLQRFDEAEKQIDAAMRDHPGPDPEAQTVLANLRRYQGLTVESISEYRKALLLARGRSPEAHIGLAIALEQAGKADDAINEYRIGIDQDMDTEPILYFLLGSALEKYQRYKEAIDAYGVYLRLDPAGQYASAVESIIARLKEELDRK